MKTQQSYVTYINEEVEIVDHLSSFFRIRYAFNGCVKRDDGSKMKKYKYKHNRWLPMCFIDEAIFNQRKIVDKNHC